MDFDRQCRFCVFYVVTEGQGSCHRHAPVVCANNSAGLVYSEWPRVSETDWCGEYVFSVRPYPGAQAEFMSSEQEPKSPLGRAGYRS